MRPAMCSTNDIDVDAFGETRAVTGIRTGQETVVGGGTMDGVAPGTNSTNGTVVVGTYGTLTIGADGTYRYVVDNANHGRRAPRRRRYAAGDLQLPGQRQGRPDRYRRSGHRRSRDANDNPVASDDVAAAQAQSIVGGIDQRRTRSSAAPSRGSRLNPVGNVITIASRPIGVPSPGNGIDSDVDRTDNPNTLLRVSAIRTGSESGSGCRWRRRQRLAGAYGTLTLNADGSYVYDVDSRNRFVWELPAGATLTETFTYTLTDTAGLTDTGTDHDHGLWRQRPADRRRRVPGRGRGGRRSEWHAGHRPLRRRDRQRFRSGRRPVERHRDPYRRRHRRHRRRPARGSLRDADGQRRRQLHLRRRQRQTAGRGAAPPGQHADRHASSTPLRTRSARPTAPRSSSPSKGRTTTRSASMTPRPPSRRGASPTASPASTRPATCCPTIPTSMPSAKPGWSPRSAPAARPAAAPPAVSGSPWPGLRQTDAQCRRLLPVRRQQRQSAGRGTAHQRPDAGRDLHLHGARCGGGHRRRPADRHHPGGQRYAGRRPPMPASPSRRAA